LIDDALAGSLFALSVQQQSRNNVQADLQAGYEVFRDLNVVTLWVGGVIAKHDRRWTR
jgi:hypothetical protein